MKPGTREWVEKAEADFATAQRELRARRAPNYDAVCFHAQQCGEKYLKARLQEAGIAFPKTHSLVALLGQILALEPLWTVLERDAAQLTLCAVEFRYPGKSASKTIAREALAQCERVRSLVRRSLGVPVTAARRRSPGIRRRKSTGESRKRR